ncbi:MAG: DEAD/DEAH box helicase family protein, partial [bacterium]
MAQWLKNEKSLRKRLLDIPALPNDKLRDCQIDAINNLEKSFKEYKQKALIQMATGSGKTFTMANVIEQVKKPTLILSHNKTLAAQLYAEFKQFFPNNA